MKRLIIKEGVAHSCYFRTSVEDGERKALLKITERCNLRCAHCFANSGRKGMQMSLGKIKKFVIPRFLQCNVARVTLTGGEPFLHKDLLLMTQLFLQAGIKVSICSNATLISDLQIEKLAFMNEQFLKKVALNISLDGFSEESHGNFRGVKGSFNKAKQTAEKLAKSNLLKGILCTPNDLAMPSEYRDLCIFGKNQGVQYILMNPLAKMGRGNQSQSELASSEEMMMQIRRITADLPAVFVRFPNQDHKLPLGGCEAGKIFYVFTNGDISICPYISFAIESVKPRSSFREFIVGNIFEEEDLEKQLIQFDKNLLRIGGEECKNCKLKNQCLRGCPASVIAEQGCLKGRDSLCPF